MKKELELYVHIPFCVKKCAYCDFLSGPAGEAEKAAYTDALLREIKSVKDAYRDYPQLIRYLETFTHLP